MTVGLFHRRRDSLRRLRIYGTVKKNSGKKKKIASLFGQALCQRPSFGLFGKVLPDKNTVEFRSVFQCFFDQIDSFCNVSICLLSVFSSIEPGEAFQLLVLQRCDAL